MYEVEIDRITNPSDGVQFDRIVISIDPDQIPTKDQLINVHINKEYIRYILTHTLTWLDQNYQKHGKMKKEKDKEHLHEGLYQYPKITNEKSLHNDLFFNRINYLKKKFIVATNEIQNSKGHQKSDSKRKLSKKIMTEMYKAVDDRLQIQVKLSTYSALSKDRIDYYLKKKCHIIIFSSPNNISSIWSTVVFYLPKPDM